MYLKLLSAVAIVLGACQCVYADEPLPVQLRVLTYNIHHGEGVDRELDLDRIASVIRSVKPDIVALQEVDHTAKRSQKVDQPTTLARMTKMNVAFGANIQLQGGHYGNAVLSRFPIASHRNHLLPNTDNGEQRGVLIADVLVPELADPLRVLATHFDHRKNDIQRVQSTKFLNVLVRRQTGPAILMGDMNDVIGSPTIKLLDSHWQRTNQDEMPSVPVSKPQRQIDFVFVRPQSQWSVVQTKVLDEAVASDHRAVFSELVLRADGHKQLPPKSKR